jgi:hypothetical protein
MSAQEVVAELERQGAFLHGSREKFNNRDFSHPADWDFAIAYDDVTAHLQYDGGLISFKEPNNVDFAEFVVNAFNWSNNPTYIDSNFAGLKKHRLFPNITLQLKKDLQGYIRMWHKVPVEYYKQYLWKSNPEIIASIGDDKEKDKAFKRFRTDTFEMLYQTLGKPSITEFM